MLPDDDRGRGGQVVLIHLSDVHIGTSLMPSPGTFQGRLRSGYNPHDFRLLRPLQLAILDARRLVGLRDNEPLNVVISGDLTQSGVDNDYATAMALLHQRWQWRFGPQGRWIGLGLPREHTFTVPGNHDHWRRAKYQTGHTRGLAPDWFESTPWRRSVESSDGTLRVELYGVDSNSGLEDSNDPGKRNLFAGGKVSDDELFGLEDRLAAAQLEQKPGQAVVRALVCHHALSNNGGFFDARPLSDKSRDALAVIALGHDISVALTGHTHAFHAQDWRIEDREGRRGVLKELRCGTTLQATKSRPGLQGFWVHHIARSPRGDGYQWTAWKYQSGGKSFDRDADAPVTFGVAAVRTLPGP